MSGYYIPKRAKKIYTRKQVRNQPSSIKKYRENSVAAKLLILQRPGSSMDFDG